MVKAIFPLFFLCALSAAIASDQRTLDGTSRFWLVALAVQVVVLLAYVSSSLASWARWQDGMEARLTIVQGMAVSILGGNIAYYGGYYALPGWGYTLSEVACFIMAALAGYGGDKFVSPLLSTVTGFFSRLAPKPNDPGK